MKKYYEGHKVYLDGKYPAIYINKKNAHIHRLVWIKYNGEIPKECIIHHINEDKTDWDINNLELLNRSEHIHKHKDIVRRKGVKITGYYEGQIYYFNNELEACKFANVKPVAISRIFNGKQHQSKGWTFTRGWTL